jgi:hydrogenase/urease accessory protein HupE
MPPRCKRATAATRLSPGRFQGCDGSIRGDRIFSISAISFVLGFTVATATLHSIGIGMGFSVIRFNPVRVRYACGISGLAIAMFGLGLLTKSV